MATTKIFVGSLPDGTTGDDLRALFEAHGPVAECDVIKDYGFVHMVNDLDARAAIVALNGHEFRGVAISVEESRSRVRHYPGMGGRRTCFRCGRHGHWSKECPRSSAGAGGPGNRSQYGAGYARSARTGGSRDARASAAPYSRRSRYDDENTADYYGSTYGTGGSSDRYGGVAPSAQHIGRFDRSSEHLAERQYYYQGGGGQAEGNNGSFSRGTSQQQQQPQQQQQAYRVSGGYGRRSQSPYYGAGDYDYYDQRQQTADRQRPASPVANPAYAYSDGSTRGVGSGIRSDYDYYGRRSPVRESVSGSATVSGATAAYGYANGGSRYAVDDVSARRTSVLAHPSVYAQRTQVSPPRGGNYSPSPSARAYY